MKLIVLALTILIVSLIKATTIDRWVPIELKFWPTIAYTVFVYICGVILWEIGKWALWK